MPTSYPAGSLGGIFADISSGIDEGVHQNMQSQSIELARRQQNITAARTLGELVNLPEAVVPQAMTMWLKGAGIDPKTDQGKLMFDSIVKSQGADRQAWAEGFGQVVAKKPDIDFKNVNKATLEQLLPVFKEGAELSRKQDVAKTAASVQEPTTDVTSENRGARVPTGQPSYPPGSQIPVLLGQARLSENRAEALYKLGTPEALAEANKLTQLANQTRQHAIAQGLQTTNGVTYDVSSGHPVIVARVPGANVEFRDVPGVGLISANKADNSYKIIVPTQKEYKIENLKNGDVLAVNPRDPGDNIVIASGSGSAHKGESVVAQRDIPFNQNGIKGVVRKGAGLMAADDGKGGYIARIPNKDGTDFTTVNIPSAALAHASQNDLPTTSSFAAERVNQARVLDQAIRSGNQYVNWIKGGTPTGLPATVLSKLQGAVDVALTTLNQVPGGQTFINDVFKPFVNQARGLVNTIGGEGDDPKEIAKARKDVGNLLFSDKLEMTKILEEAMVLGLSQTGSVNGRIPLEQIKEWRKKVSTTGVFGPGSNQAIARLTKALEYMKDAHQGLLEQAKTSVRPGIEYHENGRYVPGRDDNIPEYDDGPDGTMIRIK